MCLTLDSGSLRAGRGWHYNEPQPRTPQNVSEMAPFLLQSADDFSELSFRISELAREPRGPRERREDGAGECWG